MPSESELWEWLTEAEKSLEEVILKFNELVHVNELLERKILTQGILIQSLRKDNKNQNAALQTCTSQLVSLNTLSSSAMLQMQNLKREIATLRSDRILEIRKEMALSKLLLSESATKKFERQRIHELICELRPSQDKVEQVQNHSEVQMLDNRDEKNAFKSQDDLLSEQSLVQTFKSTLKILSKL